MHTVKSWLLQSQHHTTQMMLTIQWRQVHSFNGNQTYQVPHPRPFWITEGCVLKVALDSLLRHLLLGPPHLNNNKPYLENVRDHWKWNYQQPNSPDFCELKSGVVSTIEKWKELWARKCERPSNYDGPLPVHRRITKSYIVHFPTSPPLPINLRGSSSTVVKEKLHNVDGNSSWKLEW